jgi:hypothetical protein
MYIYQRPTSWERPPQYPMADDVVIPASVVSTTNLSRVALIIAGAALAHAAYKKFVKHEPLLAANGGI